MKRVGIDSESAQKVAEMDYKVEIANRFTGESVKTHPLIAYLIRWVYAISNDYESGINKVRISDFDRIRFWIAKVDSNAYMTCID